MCSLLIGNIQLGNEQCLTNQWDPTLGIILICLGKGLECIAASWQIIAISVGCQKLSSANFNDNQGSLSKPTCAVLVRSQGQEDSASHVMSYRQNFIEDSATHDFHTTSFSSTPLGHVFLKLFFKIAGYVCIYMKRLRYIVNIKHINFVENYKMLQNWDCKEKSLE